MVICLNNLISSVFVWNVLIIGFLVRMCVCFAIYFDADSKGIKNKNVYSILSFFFPLILLIVYLFSRSNELRIQPKICNYCHCTLNSNIKICPNCHSNSFTYYKIVNEKEKKTKSNVFLILSVVFYILCFIYTTSIVVYTIGKEYDNYEKYDYSYDYDEHSFDIDEFEEYFQDYDIDDDYFHEPN